MGRARPLARLERQELIEAETHRIIDAYLELGEINAVAAALGIKPHRVRMRIRESGTSTTILNIERTVREYRRSESLETTAVSLGVLRLTVMRRLQSAVVIGLLEEAPQRPDRAWVSTRCLSQAPRQVPSRGLSPEEQAKTVALYREVEVASSGRRAARVDARGSATAVTKHRSRISTQMATDRGRVRASSADVSRDSQCSRGCTPTRALISSDQKSARQRGCRGTPGGVAFDAKRATARAQDRRSDRDEDSVRAAWL